LSLSAITAGIGDENLWGVYREDFEGLTKETFLKGDKHLVRIFRDYLYL
jgi:hypothetical protein